MTRSCTRVSILVIALLFAFTTVGFAAPSDWADVVETPSPRAQPAPKRTSVAKAQPKKKAKRVAAKKQKAKPRAKAKKRR